MKGLRFIGSDPVLIGCGSTSTNDIYFARLLADRFEVKWQKTVSSQTASDGFLYDSKDSNDQDPIFSMFVTEPNKYPLVITFDYENGMISRSNILKYSMENVKINYSKKQKDYVLSGEIVSTNQLVFVRVSDSLSFSDLRITKANNQANYNIKSSSIFVDANANLLLGGIYQTNKLFMHRTGEELSCYA
jgi:hypothetical protein